MLETAVKTGNQLFVIDPFDQGKLHPFRVLTQIRPIPRAAPWSEISNPFRAVDLV